MGCNTSEIREESEKGASPALVERVALCLVEQRPDCLRRALETALFE